MLVVPMNIENYNFEVALRLAEQGGNHRAEDENYNSTHTLAKRRLAGEGTRYRPINPTFHEKVLRALE